MIASLVIWALGYFPRNTEIIDKYDDLKVETIEKYHKIESENPGLADVVEENLNKELSRINFERNNALQKASFIGKIGRSMEPVMSPLGFDWKMSISLLAGVAAKEVVVSTMGVLYQAEGDDDNISEALITKIRNARHESGELKGEPIFTPVTSFAYLMFILLYFPCVAVVAAVKKESGQWKWAIFMVVYTTTLAWVIAFLVNQVGSLLI
jgi:ferrous iron transport protein B